MTRSPSDSESVSRRLRNLYSRDEHDASKPAVVGIAAAATVIIVVLIGGGLFWFIRRRKRRRNGNKHVRSKSTESVDIESTSLDDRTSKAPLIAQEHQASGAEHRGSPAPRYDDDDDQHSVTLNMPHRTLSAATTRSLPPSYAAAVRTSIGSDIQNDYASYATHQSSHRPGSSAEGSGGLRPLMLVDSQQHRAGSRSHSRSGSPDSMKDHLPAIPQKPAGRARAESRFREEDLDM